MLHRIVEGPFADDRTSVFPPSCCCRGACRGGCFGRVGCSWGDSRELPDSGHVVMCCGPVPAMAPFPVPGLRSRLAFLLVTCAAVGCLLMAGVCLCVEDAHEKLRGRPPGDARRCLCAGFLQCGSFVEVCTVVCVSAQERGLVLVRGGGGGGGRVALSVSGSGASLLAVCLDVVPLQPRYHSLAFPSPRRESLPHKVVTKPAEPWRILTGLETFAEFPEPSPQDCVLCDSIHQNNFLN